jgi:DNA transformation protein
MTEDNLLSFVADQLSDMGEVSTRRMFGGWHISHGGVFFAIVFKERLYFKTSEISRVRYEEMGMGPFRPRAKVTLKTLYEVPVDILEDTGDLTLWAREAIAAQEEATEQKRRPKKRGKS